MKNNYKMTISYDGTRYYGWEHQPGQPMTIQGKLETVLARMLQAEQEDRAEQITGEEPEWSEEKKQKSGNSPKGSKGDSLTTVNRKLSGLPAVTVIGAGRTDAGVHARAMTANVILDTEMTESEIWQYMNRYLPDDISVDDLKICADRFHSRFMAKGKTYRYTYWYSPEGAVPVFDRKYVTVLDAMPDLARMKKAAEDIVGMHDFKSFCGNSHMKKSTVRLVDSIDIRQRKNYIYITIHGSGFLQNMVRIICGTLLEIGYGRRADDSIPALLEARDRRLAGPTAPAKGLTLLEVDY
jgi:tRNA pseudouridine38-40 synthase